MSFSYDRYDSRRSSTRRSTLGYWVPLLVTSVLAAGGLAAWIWSTRDDHESSTSSSDDDDLSYPEEDPRGRDGPPGFDAQPGYGAAARGAGPGEQQGQGDMMTRVSDVLRRTPSPQQVFDTASKRVVAGVAAAGAVVGTALNAIREGDEEHKGEFDDHRQWSEEVTRREVSTTETENIPAVAPVVPTYNATETRRDGPQKYAPDARRKTVVVVLSGETLGGEEDEAQGAAYTEHVSLLSQLPPVNPATTKLLILIYNPEANKSPAQGPLRTTAPPSLGSSYSNVNTPAVTPGEELASMDPAPYTPGSRTPGSTRASGGSYFDVVYRSAVAHVTEPSGVMPFGTRTGWVHMLKHLAPDVVYVVDALSGERGENIEAVKGWVHGTVCVVVGGDGSGLGALVDTEDESEGRNEKKSKWWERSDMIGLGKGVEVVDGVRVGDDWERRVVGRQ
ncbi:hypothetical protein EJ06DRAFT_585301 [Trichodelitschia bisporula]|uniref:Uncharacterized protein n=1 Tax=Trichodelitschia bisporula TaxID=703511 RepID=A0A6G1HKS2_9PEZI|nr:hypothetical protein EJ06DRAFT_585301 [Trichodelitschia bisporula]